MSENFINPRKLPRTLELAIRHHAYDKGPANLSTTEASLSPRIRQLRALYTDREVDISDRIYALLGSLTHQILEEATRELVSDNPKLTLRAMTEVLQDFSEGKIPSEKLVEEMDLRVWEAVKETALEDHKVLVEKRLFGEIGGWTISGKPDWFDIAQGQIEDYKLCSVWNHVFGIKEDWVQQINTYKWLLEMNGYTVNSAVIHAIFRDFQKSKATWDKKYPQEQWVVYPIELWPTKQIEKYLEGRVKAHAEAELVEDPNDLPLCTDEERWTSKEEWAVTKEGRKRAIRCLDTRPEALVWIERNKKPGEELKIEHRPGEDRRCLGNFCEVAQYCNYGRMLQAKQSIARSS